MITELLLIRQLKRHRGFKNVQLLVQMSTIVKTKLKGAREALGKKDYEKAKILATSALEYDPENYNA